MLTTCWFMYPTLPLLCPCHFRHSETIWSVLRLQIQPTKTALFPINNLVRKLPEKAAIGGWIEGLNTFIFTPFSILPSEALRSSRVPWFLKSFPTDINEHFSFIESMVSSDSVTRNQSSSSFFCFVLFFVVVCYYFFCFVDFFLSSYTFRFHYFFSRCLILFISYIFFMF